MPMRRLLAIASAIVVAVVHVLVVQADDNYKDGVSSANYGADVSYPMHHPRVVVVVGEEDDDKAVPPPSGTNQQQYDLYSDNMKGCVDHYNARGHDGHEACWNIEEARIAMNLRQPQSMVNYTQNGFVKIRAPEAVWKLVQEFWQANKDELIEEQWGIGEIFVNHWKTPAQFVAVDNETLPGGGYLLKNQIWNAARDTLTEWTGYQMADCSCYGIRVYREDAVLTPHVDRLPLVSSAILNVAQDLDEPWPLEVIGHDGRAHNITMEPGDMILYESHSIIHGRPFPMKGRYFANVFMHFEPVAPLSEPDPVFQGDLPPYLIPGSPNEAIWRDEHPSGWNAVVSERLTVGTTEAHHAAVSQDMDHLRAVLDRHPAHVSASDEYGWTPLHEAARSGHTDAIRVLIERGADMDALTAVGESVLGLAYDFIEQSDEDSTYKSQPDEHPAIQYLNELGAGRVMPDGIGEEL